VRAGMRNAAAKGSKIGRPPIAVDMSRLAELKSAGYSHTRCAKMLGVDRCVLRRVEAA